MKLFKPWLLILIGILFNIASAVVTHYFIGLNNEKLEVIGQKINSFETLIDSQWRLKTELDRTQEFLLLLATLRPQDFTGQSNKITSLISSKLKSIEQQNLNKPKTILKKSNIDYDTITSTIDHARHNIIDRINDTYLEKVSIENQLSPIKQDNALLMSLAIFLQVTGLILVLSRDLKG